MGKSVGVIIKLSNSMGPVPDPKAHRTYDSRRAGGGQGDSKGSVPLMVALHQPATIP